MLEISREQTDNDLNAWEFISLKGSLDTYSARDFDRFFQDFLRAGFHFFILDASLLEKVSSEGLASLVRLTKDVESLEGSFVFLHPNSEIEMILSFLNLDLRIPIFSKVEDALDFLSRQERKEQNFSIGSQESIPEVNAEALYSKQRQSKSVKQAGPNLMVACTHCGLSLSAKRSGAYMCPACGEQFQVKV